MGLSKCIDEVTAKYSAQVVGELPQGHTGALLKIMEQAGGCRLVLKMGEVGEARVEVQQNARGYRALQHLRCGAPLPHPIDSGEVDGVAYLVLGWAGDETWAMRDRRDPITMKQIQTWLGLWSNSVKYSLHPWHDFNSPEVDSLTMVWRILSEVGLLHRSAAHMLPQAGVKTRLPKAGMTILDFTPDNIFLSDQSYVFIDPWDQFRFLGNPAVSLGQFSTLSQEIYHLPCGDMVRQAVDELIDRDLAQIFGRNQVLRLRAGFLMGQALQYALSSFVRIDSEPQVAAQYARESEQSVKQVLQIV